MDIEKLIEQLKKSADFEDYPVVASFAAIIEKKYLREAATALSTLQAENAQLRESRYHWKRLAHELNEGVNGKDAEHERLQAENEKLRAELEQVKQERDAAIKEIFQWTGCPACKHWDSADNWCNKHDRSADSCDGCSTPEWHGLEKA